MSELKVLPQDQEEDIRLFKMALNLAGYKTNYQQAELLKTIHDEVMILKGDYSLKDGARIESEWEKKWIEYFKEKEQE